MLSLQAIVEKSQSSTCEVLILLHLLFDEEAVDHGIYVRQNFDCRTQNAQNLRHNRFENEGGMGNSFLKMIPVEVDGLWFWGIPYNLEYSSQCLAREFCNECMYAQVNEAGWARDSF